MGDMGNCIEKETENFLALMGPRVDATPLKEGEEPLIFLIGGPGVGKNTLSKKLASRYNLKLVSVTNILREEVNKETDRGKFFKSYMEKGNIIPAEYIVQLVIREMLKNQSTIGYLVVGFPRDKKQVIH